MGDSPRVYVACPGCGEPVDICKRGQEAIECDDCSIPICHPTGKFAFRAAWPD